ncbi:MAG: thioredoxin fold domain-containing protein [Bacteroidota bacterium]|nr:thioredoxin fold domain-containing protein [Bacteroidota bacterium]
MIKKKQTPILMLLFIWSTTAFASDTTIAFNKIEYTKVFEIAKREHKAVMLYFHFDGCGACLKMEKTAFKDKQVYDFYNSKFINFEINTKKETGIELNRIYNVRLFPSFIFFDNSGKELHKIVGVFTPEDFFKQAKNALYTNKTLSNYKDLYNKGNRDANFLFEYAYMLRDASELDSTVANEYLSSVNPTEFRQEKNIRFIFEFSVHKFKIFIPFQTTAFTFLVKNKVIFYKYFEKDQVNTRIVWILKYAIYKAIDEKDDSTFNTAIEMLKEYDTGVQYIFKEMDGRLTGVIGSKNLVLSSLLAFYDKKGEADKYHKTLIKYISKIWNDATELNNFAWNIYEQEEDRDKIKVAMKCAVRSIELNNNYSNNDTYACLLYKLGDSKKALIQAAKAIELAKKSNEDYSQTKKFVERINCH